VATDDQLGNGAFLPMAGLGEKGRKKQCDSEYVGYRGLSIGLHLEGLLRRVHEILGRKRKNAFWDKHWYIGVWNCFPSLAVNYHHKQSLEAIIFETAYHQSKKRT